MIVAVSTIKDTLPHVRRYVEGNLRGGVDLLVVFLDASDAEVEAYLAGVPEAVHVVADEGWWRGERPDQLNVRQRVGANLVKALATRIPEIAWVFHLDGDEIAWLDRDLLAAVPADRRAVRLAPLEAVAQRHWEGDPTLFKRSATPEELSLLHERGAISAPTNSAYFHGHPFGKAGVRPSLDLWLRLHDVVDAAGEVVTPYARPRLRMLHYESYDGEDFVRKWRALMASGGGVSFRADRQGTADAVRDVLERGLDPAARDAALMEIFAERVEDDLPLLRAAGLIVEADPRTWPARSGAVPGAVSGSVSGVAERLTELLEAVRGESKLVVAPGHPPREAEALLARIDGPSGGVAAPLRGVRSWLRRR